MASRNQQLPEPIATLKNEHRYMSLLLETMLERVSENGLTSVSDYYLVQDIARYMHEYPDVVHHPTEDILFERLLTRDPASRKDVQRLLRDHERLEGNMAEIVELLDRAFQTQTPTANDTALKAIERYARQLKKHMEIEETVLFPKTIECLANKDWKAISAQLNKVDDPLFGQTVDSEYRALYEYFSNRPNNVAGRLTQFGFLQFDNFIVSADALEHGMTEMWKLVTHHASSIADETRSATDGYTRDLSFARVMGTPVRLLAYIGTQSLRFGTDAIGIYLNTAKKMASPFLPGQSAHSQKKPR